MATVAMDAATSVGRPSLDTEKLHAFLGRLMGDMAGAIAASLCALGDRLGLFKALAGGGPATSTELAERAGIHERYAREWLRGMASARYLEYDPASCRYSLPVEHALALADEGGLLFMGGAFDQLRGLAGPLDQLASAFRSGDGVPQAAYDDELYRGIERMSAGWFNNLLVQQWIPALPGVQERLEQGGNVADIGCGSGQALIRLAQAFPRSRFVGYDTFGEAVARATANAERAAVGDRVRFVRRDAAEQLRERYDLITAFDMLHDAPRPDALLRAVREALTPEGVLLVLEVAGGPTPEANVGPLATIKYGTSVLYCLPTALANGAEGLGSLGLPEPALRALCTEAGLTQVRRIPQQNPFNALYEVRP